MSASAVVDNLTAALVLLRDVDLAALRAADDGGVTLVAVTAEAVARRLAAIQLHAASEVAYRSREGLGVESLAARHGHVRPAPFLENILRISGADASSRLKLGSVFRGEPWLTGEILEPRFPEVARAMEAGEINSEAAVVVVRALEDIRRVACPDDLEAAEKGLVDYASANSVQYVSDLAVVVRDRLDPDGVLPREKETRARRSFILGRERNGIVPFRGGSDPLTAALLKAAFDEANAPGAKPRFLSEQDQREGTVTSTDDDGLETVTVRDIRTRDQRQWDVVGGLLAAGIRNTGFENGQLRSTAEVTAHVSVADLEAGMGVGWIEGISEPVSMKTIERLLCDAAFRRVVLGNNGEPLALGKKRYPFTAVQRKAIIARDGDECLLCGVPASWSETHHVQEYWTHGAVGTTDVDNGVILCGPHHDWLHHGEWQITMIDRIPHLLAPPEIDPTQTWKRLGKSRLAKLGKLRTAG
jgi:hypothetical protein